MCPTAGALQAASNKPVPAIRLCDRLCQRRAPRRTTIRNIRGYQRSRRAPIRKGWTREERRKWGYAGVWEISAMRKQNGETQIPYRTAVAVPEDAHRTSRPRARPVCRARAARSLPASSPGGAAGPLKPMRCTAPHRPPVGTIHRRGRRFVCKRGFRAYLLPVSMVKHSHSARRANLRFDRLGHETT